MVQITLRVLTRPNPESLPTIYRTIGVGTWRVAVAVLDVDASTWPLCCAADYDEKILPSIVNEVLKQVIALYNAPQLLTQREQVSKKIKVWCASCVSVAVRGGGVALCRRACAIVDIVPRVSCRRAIGDCRRTSWSARRTSTWCSRMVRGGWFVTSGKLSLF
jgi:hypothetical protein